MNIFKKKALSFALITGLSFGFTPKAQAVVPGAIGAAFPTITAALSAACPQNLWLFGAGTISGLAATIVLPKVCKEPDGFIACVPLFALLHYGAAMGISSLTGSIMTNSLQTFGWGAACGAPIGLVIGLYLWAKGAL